MRATLAKRPPPDTAEQRKAARSLLRASEGRQRLEDSAGPSTYGNADMGTPERVEWHLANWLKWLGTGGGVAGYSGRSAGMSDGGTSQAFEDMLDREDRRCAAIVDTIIGDLPYAQRMSVFIACGVVVMAYHLRTDTSKDLELGKLAIGLELVRRGVW